MLSNYDRSRGMKILVVDDFPTQRKLVRKTLASLGFENVEEATDGQHALEKLQGTSFDFVICDWNMPVMMGIELLRAVRSDTRIRKIPFLMVTAEAKRESVIEAAQAGVTDFIAKPFTVESLQEKMQRILNGEARS